MLCAQGHVIAPTSPGPLLGIFNGGVHNPNQKKGPFRDVSFVLLEMKITNKAGCAGAQL